MLPISDKPIACTNTPRSHLSRAIYPLAVSKVWLGVVMTLDSLVYKTWQSLAEFSGLTPRLWRLDLSLEGLVKGLVLD